MESRPVDLARLVAIIVQEVARVGQRAGRACACHAVAEDCCPDRLQGVIDAGATRLGASASVAMNSRAASSTRFCCL